MKTEKKTILLGMACAILVSIISFSYYKYRDQHESLRESNPILEGIDALDLRYNDFKFKARDERHTSSPVALIALDGDSINEIGRWPWSRELIAEMTQKLIDLGASSVGYDVIFSEPEKANPEADLKMGAVVAANKDKVVLGVQSDDLTNFLPYQDYCVSEAFLGSGGDQIVKLNPAFIVDESGSFLDEVNWAPVFEVLFSNIKQSTEGEVLKTLGKSDVSQLTGYQKNYLASQKTRAIFDFCKSWLTKEDVFLQEGTKEKVVDLYMKTLGNLKEFKGKDFDEIAGIIKKRVKFHSVPQYGDWLGNIPVLQNEAQYTASFIAKQDSDGYVRRYPLFFRSGNKLGSSYIPSLALQTYLAGTGYRAEVKVSEEGDARTITSFSIVNPATEKKVVDLPVDSRGQLTIDYYGKQLSIPYVPAKELFSEFDDMTIQQKVLGNKNAQLLIETKKVNKKEFFKGRKVIVGATATGLYDLRTTPLEPNYPGPEIHMTVLANLLDQSFIKYWNQEARWMPLIVLIIGIVVSVAWSYMGAMVSMSMLLILNLIFWGADLYLFVYHKLQISTLFILIQLSTVYFVITVFKYFTEERKKKELKQTFSKYVSPAVVDEILKEPDNLKLGGRKQRMTVFFSDVRGFTTISEKLSPTDLSNLLNRYLTPMTEIVFANKGTLDKYMGDAIMAFFGAPIVDDQHAKQACRCALKSMEKLKELQEHFKAENLPNIDIGIGINTGEMSVGNMGSNIVQNYTVMGDAVNLGSRLEGINKEYGTHIIISQYTNEEVKDAFVTREVDRVKVKGKNEPVRIFELMAEGTLQSHRTEQIKIFNQGLEKYFKMRFDDALEDFKKSFELNPEDKVSKLYIERCQDFIEEPPPENWDGVFVMKTK
ncbi:MAG: CHASE2 domain-containing protein [Pseudobdellovibrionaceae bacterium]